MVSTGTSTTREWGEPVAIQADAATIHAAAKDTLNAKQVAEGELSKLRSEVSGLAPLWTGAAGTSFQNVMTRWDESTRKLIDAMEGIADMLNIAGTEITATDEEGQASLNKFDSALNQ